MEPQAGIEPATCPLRVGCSTTEPLRRVLRTRRLILTKILPMTIRVVSIISRMNVGGPAVLLSELIKNLPAEEFHHTLITGTCQSNEIDYLDSHPLESEVIYIDEIKRSVLPIADVKSFFRLMKTLKALKPDIVHTHTSKAGVLGRLASRIAAPGAKVIHTYHGHILYGYFGPFLTKTIVFAEKRLSKFTDLLIAITNPVKQDLLNAGIGRGNSWKIIHPAVPENRFPRKCEITAIRKLLWIGRFTAIKDPMLAIKCFQELSNSDPGAFELTMVGDGELLNDSKKYSEENFLGIKFVGWSNQVQEYLSETDLLLLTSTNEGLGMVALEAAQFGVPTIATDVGGVSEFISDGVTGYFCAPYSTSFSQKILELANNLEEFTEVGMAALQKVEQDFSLHKFILEHEVTYREIYFG